jgi:hypothetical protein
MKAMLSRRPSPAMVVALIALFAATGGVGYAAATIDSGDIVNNRIRSVDMKNRNLRGVDVKKNTLGGGVIKESTLAKVPSAGSADTAQQATSAQDAVNAQNSINAQTAAAVGPNGVARAALRDDSVSGPKLGPVVVRTQTVTVPNGDSAPAEAECHDGEQLLGGGARWDGDPANLRTVHSYPLTSSWFARGYNGTAAPRDFTTRALCLDN